MSAPGTELIAVPVLQIPVAIWARSQEHIDELLREFTLISAQLRQQPGPSEVPVRLTQLIEELVQQYGGLNTDQENRLAEAAASGRNEIDLLYHVPPQAAEASQRLLDILEEADAYCRAGTHLLTLATPPELDRFIRWFLGEFVAQLSGCAPTPYPEFRG